MTPLDFSSVPSPHRRRRRPWSDVTGITLHQTACLMGESPQRWHQTAGHAGTAAHFGVTRGGLALLIHPLDVVTPHANGLNSRDVGMELDGWYAGVEGKPRTLWQPGGTRREPMVPTPALVTAALDAIRWIVAEVAAHGGRVRYLHAHRQSSRTRQSDPGSALWQAVALPAMAELGLTSGPVGWATGDGYPIPAEWDARCVGVRY